MESRISKQHTEIYLSKQNQERHGACCSAFKIVYEIEASDMNIL